MAKENENIELLMTMPGIGFIGATTIASYTDNIERFDGNFNRLSRNIKNSKLVNYYLTFYRRKYAYIKIINQINRERMMKEYRQSATA